jgi:hypothetical protein
MSKTLEIKSLEPEGNTFRKMDLAKIQGELVQIIDLIQANRQVQPFKREMIEISLRIPKSNHRCREEFSFSRIEAGAGMIQKLEEWIVLLEKQDVVAVIVLDAYLYPYRAEGGRKLMVKVVKHRLPPTLSSKLPWHMEVNATVVERERKAARTEIRKALPPDEDFLQTPIDYDFGKWDLSDTDGTRGILRKTFGHHNIVSPGDLRNFLGTDNPTRREWNVFIIRLNQHDETLRLVIGPVSSSSLLRWMRKYWMIPENFRKI